MKRVFYDYSVVHIIGRKQQIPKNILKSFVVILLVAAVVFAVIFFMFNSRQITIKQRDFYFVVLSNHASYDLAQKKCEEIRENGGSGYVLKGEIYRVTAFVYMNYDDANSVVSKLKLNGEDAYVYKKSLKKTTLKMNSYLHKKNMKIFIKSCNKIIQDLYDCTLQVQKGEMTISVAEKLIQEEIQSFEKNYKKLISIRQLYEKNEKINQIMVNGEEFANSLYELNDDFSEMKYILCKMVDLCINFTNL